MPKESLKSEFQASLMFFVVSILIVMHIMLICLFLKIFLQLSCLTSTVHLACLGCNFIDVENLITFTVTEYYLERL